MKVLFTVEFYYSSGGGGIQEQARQIAEHIALRGHDVVVATSYVPARDQLVKGVHIEQFRIFGNTVKGVNGETTRYQQFLKESEYDVLVNFAANTWTTDLALPLLKEISAKKVLSTPGLSKVNDARYWAYYTNAYAEALKDYNRVVYTSANYRDKLFGDEHGGREKAVVIPNGAGEEFLAPPLGFRKKYWIGTKFLLLTVANHYFLKGHGFVREAFRRIHRKDATLVIIGDRPARHSWYSCYPTCKLAEFFGSRLMMLEHVPRSLVVSAYQEADLFLFGSQLECSPLVMYESFAGKTPFVTTDVGNVRDHEQYVNVVKTPEEMAAAANTILENDAARKDVADRAFAAWQNNYTWDKIAEQYEKLFHELVTHNS